MSERIPKKKSFTLKGHGRPRILITPCHISRAFNPISCHPQIQVKKYKAIWDTGATNCAISTKVIQGLGLKPIGKAQVNTASSDNSGIISNVYLISIFLPNNVAIPFVKVTECNMSSADVLIGMDIISQGDFAITHKDGDTKFTFQMPSTHDIDFLEETKEKKVVQPLTPKVKAPGRNDPCPCGSGKKYKNCHGK